MGIASEAVDAVVAIEEAAMMAVVVKVKERALVVVIEVE
jgi:hypothetical protein